MSRSNEEWSAEQHAQDLMSGKIAENATYYELLGFRNEDHASIDLNEVKRRYKKLALILHPDKTPGENAEKAFKQVNNANETLSDSEKKVAYDRNTIFFSAAPGFNAYSGSGFRSTPPRAQAESTNMTSFLINQTQNYQNYGLKEADFSDPNYRDFPGYGEVEKFIAFRAQILRSMDKVVFVVTVVKALQDNYPHPDSYAHINVFKTLYNMLSPSTLDFLITKARDVSSSENHFLPIARSIALLVRANSVSVNAASVDRVITEIKKHTSEEVKILLENFDRTVYYISAGLTVEALLADISAPNENADVRLQDAKTLVHREVMLDRLVATFKMTLEDKGKLTDNEKKFLTHPLVYQLIGFDSHDVSSALYSAKVLPFLDNVSSLGMFPMMGLSTLKELLPLLEKGMLTANQALNLPVDVYNLILNHMIPVIASGKIPIEVVLNRDINILKEIDYCLPLIQDGQLTVDANGQIQPAAEVKFKLAAADKLSMRGNARVDISVALDVMDGAKLLDTVSNALKNYNAKSSSGIGGLAQRFLTSKPTWVQEKIATLSNTSDLEAKKECALKIAKEIFYDKCAMKEGQYVVYPKDECGKHLMAELQNQGLIVKGRLGRVYVEEQYAKAPAPTTARAHDVPKAR